MNVGRESTAGCSDTSCEQPSHSITREYPACPLLGVGALIVRGNRIVLVRRANPPSRGEWSVPGGLVKVGETLSQAVCREALEETGLRVEPSELVELLDRIFYDPQGRIRYHYVLADYLCHAVGGMLTAGSDASEAAWFARDELGGLNLAPVTLQVVLRGLTLSDRGRTGGCDHNAP
jgi:8-oxo-dGTP diphosphatase